jgi:hypothetical protein
VTVTTLEAQLAAARAEAKAANAHAVLMARENLKIKNLLNAKTGEKKEGRTLPGRCTMPHSRGGAGTEAEGGPGEGTEGGGGGSEMTGEKSESGAKET